jgi:hypothetical protein
MTHSVKIIEKPQNVTKCKLQQEMECGKGFSEPKGTFLDIQVCVMASFGIRNDLTLSFRPRLDITSMLSPTTSPSSSETPKTIDRRFSPQ